MFHSSLQISLKLVESKISHSYIFMTSFIIIIATVSFPYTVCLQIITCLTSKMWVEDKGFAFVIFVLF